MSSKGKRALARLAILSAVTTAGCGDPLVPGETYESPLLSFGPFFTEPHDVAALAGMTIGIVWIDPLQLRDDVPQPPTSMAVSGPTAARTYQVDLFTPPPEAAIRRIPDPTTNEVAVAFAIGEIVLYADGNGDGTFELSPRAAGSLMFPPDAFTGSTSNRVIIYVETPAKPGALDGAVWRTLTEAPGFRLAYVSCDSHPAPVTTLAPDRRFPMTLARASSPELIVTRPCLSPTRPAIGALP